MKYTLVFAAMVCVVSACQRENVAAKPECDANATTITDSSIGPLFLNEGIGALRVRCGAVADTTVIVPMPTWVDTVAAKVVVVAGVPVLATFDNDRVTSLRVASPGPRTTDGIEVGTTIARFKHESGLRVSRSATTGAVLLRDRAHCGKVFELSSWGGSAPTDSAAPIAAPAIAAWSDTIRVSAITVSRCTEGAPNKGVDSAFNAREDSLSAADVAAADSVVLVATPLPAPSVTASAPPAPVVQTPALPAPPVRVQPKTSLPPAVAVPVTDGELAELRRLLIVPVEGVTKPQLRDTYSASRGTRVHEAIDIPAPRGNPVLSASDGKLMRLFDSKTGGLMVYAADPTDRFILLYGHMDRYAANMKDGMALKQGQVIGYVGTTGNAPPNTPHLHFGILRGKPSVSWSRGTAVNPYDLLVR